MTLPINTRAHIPLGFRFHPTDEELLNYYLRKKVSLENFDLDLVIPDVDLNKLEPWDLCEWCNMDIMCQTESYFFSHNDKKFLTGKRTNRATTAGFWKATGRDKAICSGGLCIGMRKTLVFYRGRAPNTEKTDWILHEYRLENGDSGLQSNEDGWVVCRIFKKHNVQEKAHQSCSNISEEEQSGTVANVESSIGLQQSSAVGHTWFCKKEVEDCPPQVAFSKLQHLESPKITPNMLCYNNNDLTRTFTEDHKVVEDSALFLKSPSMKGFNIKPFYMSEDNIPGYGDNALLTDWNVFENSGMYSPDFSNVTGDIPHCLHSSEQLPSECSSSCEVNLWNFTP